MTHFKTDLTKPHVYIDGVAINKDIALQSNDLLNRLYEIEKILSKGCVWPSDYESIKLIVKTGIKKCSR